MSRNKTTFVDIKRETIRKRAIRNELDFNLSRSLLTYLLSNPVCKKCGVFCDVEVNGSGCHKDDDFSLDRINPLKGYVPNNVQVLCCKCNNKKSVTDKYAHIRSYRKQRRF